MPLLRRVFKRPQTRKEWAAAAVAVVLLAVSAVCLWWLGRHALAVHRLTRGVGDTIFYSADGQPWFHLDERRRDVPLDRISLHLQHAVVAVEDRRFNYHPGVDPIAIARAAVRDVQRRAVVQGGSTLTQQLARTLFLSNVQTYGRKIKEAAIALLIEARLTKPQILELYLNRVYLSAGVYGVEAMSDHLYRKPAKDLTLAEAALVAGLVRAPSVLSPWTNYDGALDRSHVVLSLMREQRFISAEQEAAARLERPRIQPYRSPRDPRGGWAKDYLRQQFRNQFGGDHPPDWRVQTSFVAPVQNAAERAVASGLARLNRQGLHAALVAIDPRTGNLLAMVGGADYTTSTFNRATRTRRQPGSAFKPFVYAAALADGYSPVTTLRNLNGTVAPDDPEWRPRPVAHGDSATTVTLRDALSESNNAAAAILQQRVGTRKVLALASRAGLRDLPDVPSLALGTGLVSPLDLTAAYTMFPAGGEIVRPRAMLKVLDADGGEVFARPIERERILSAAVAFQMVTMLREVVERGTGTSGRLPRGAGPVAGKTGTTDDYMDAWFVGFSSSTVAGVWVGFDTPASIGREAYASRVALPIWADFMTRIARVRPAREFDVPGGLHREELCLISRAKPLDKCPVYTEYFKDGDDVPSQLCPVHSGSLRQVATRAVQQILRSLGDRLAGIFR
jgi:membrane peptidoglycan carboxypeptidase